MSQISESKNSGGNSGDVRIVDPIDPYSALIVRGTIIGTGILGLALYVRNSKLFATFQHVKQIPPDYFVTSKILKGVVREVEPNGLLKVEHRPTIRLPNFLTLRKKKLNQASLNLRLAGLEVSPVGVEYLNEALKLKGSPIHFSLIKPVELEPDISDADVTLKKMFRHINLNTELVRKGFARVYSADNRFHMEALQFNAAYSRLITRLLTCEKVAEQRGLGLWRRETWVERVQSYPSTAVQIVKQSTPIKLSVLCFELLRDTCLLLYFIAEQLYYIAIETLKYLSVGYRALTRGVDRVSLAYANTKRFLTQRKLGMARTDGQRVQHK